MARPSLDNPITDDQPKDVRSRRVFVVAVAAIAGMALLFFGPPAQGFFEGERPSLSSRSDTSLGTEPAVAPPASDQEVPDPPTDLGADITAIEGLAVFNTGSAACLTMAPAAASGLGPDLVQADCNGSPEQAWTFDDVGRLLNGNGESIYCVTMPEGQDGSSILGLGLCEESDASTWLAQSLGDGTIQIHSSADRSACMDGADAVGSSLALVECRVEVRYPDTQVFDLVSLDTRAGRDLVDASSGPPPVVNDVDIDDVVDPAVTPVPAPAGGIGSLSEIDGRVVTVLDHEMGTPSLLVRGARLVHIPTSEDYERCLASSGQEPVYVLADELTATGWDVDWRYHERCPGEVTQLLVGSG